MSALSDPLPALRPDLDLMPSPVPDRPGLLIRDPMGYATAVLIVPPPLVPVLALFDGARPAGDLREALARLTGRVDAGAIADELRGSLEESGFLRSETFEQRRREKHAAFAAAPVRAAAHAGGGYPEEPAAISATLEAWLRGSAGGSRNGVLGVAAPHVSPDGGFRSYAAAYSALGPGLGEKTFAVLGTSHYGEPERIGLTRKPYATPLGETRVDRERVEALAGRVGPAAVMEDYCHAVEHSIEFQVLFLQHLYGPRVRVLPVLCGPFVRSLSRGYPDDDPRTGRAIDALAELARDEDVAWVLGIDMAHVGRRYGDREPARAEQGPMRDVARRDRERLDRVAAGDARGFWDLIREGEDDLRWCGSAPLYAFLRGVRPAAAELLRYEQWNIDEGSVVSFAALRFLRPEGGAETRARSPDRTGRAE
jgi:hypothetical protein